MAYATVVNVTNTSVNSPGSTTHNISMPATVTAGNLLLMVTTCETAATYSTPGGWSLIEGDVREMLVIAKIANGTEGGTTVNVQTAAAADMGAQVYQISGWYGSLSGISANIRDFSSSSPPEQVSPWGAEENLWIAVCHANDDANSADTNFTAAPSNYTNLTVVAWDSNVNRMATARREFQSTSEDPLPFTTAGSVEFSTSATIVIRPAAPVPAPTPPAPEMGGELWGVCYGSSDAAVVVNQASGTVSAGASNGSISAFSCTGDDRLLLVDIYHIDDNLAPVVYQVYRLGQSLRFLQSWGTYQANQRIERWYLLNPTVGNGTVTVDFGAGNPVANGALIAAIACSGVDQTNPFGYENPRFGGFQTATPSGDIQAAADMLVIDGWASGTLSAGATPGSGQTQVLDVTVTPSGAPFALSYFCSWERSVGGTTTMSWSAANPSSAWKAGLATAVRGARRALVALPALTNVSCTDAIDRLGSASFTAPYTQEIFEEATIGREINLYHQDYGEIWFGKIAGRTVNINADEDATIEFVLVSLAQELQENPTYMGIITWPSNYTAQQTLTEILRFHELGAPAVWNGILSGSGFTNVTMRFDNLSIWQALINLGTAENAFIRETGVSRQIEMSRQLRDTGMVVSNVAAREEGDAAIGVLEGGFTVQEQGGHIANRVSAVGVDSGQILLDFSKSNRSSPYVIKSALRNVPTWTNAQLFFPIRESSGNKDAGAVSVTGQNRGLVTFATTAFATGIGNDGTWWDVGGLEMPGGAIAASTNGYSIRGWYHGGIGDGFVRVQAKVPEGYGDPGSDTAFITIPLQDSAGFVNANGQNGTATTAGSLAAGASPGDLVIGCLYTEGFSHVFGDAPWQQRIFTGGGGNVAISAFWAQTPDDGLFWFLSYNDNWAVLLLTIAARPFYYIEDQTAIEQYGRRAEFTVENTNKFTTAGTSAITQAANTLYDREVAHLQAHSHPHTVYEGVKCTLPQGPKQWLVGDGIRLVYRQLDPAIDINELLYVLERTQTYDNAGARHWELKLSDEPAFPLDTIEIFNRQLQRVLALEGL